MATSEKIGQAATGGDQRGVHAGGVGLAIEGVAGRGGKLHVDATQDVLSVTQTAARRGHGGQALGRGQVKLGSLQYQIHHV